MLEKIIEQFSNDAPVEFLYLILGSIIMFLVNKAYKKLTIYKQRRFIKKEINRLKTVQASVSNRVLDIANGDPYYSNDNIFIRTINLLGKTKSLYVSFPQEYKEEIESL